MVILGINTASKITQIALLKNDKILKEKEWVSDSNESEKLMPEIDDLLKKSNISYEDLKELVVIKGPGSFTSLRVGVSVANAISYIQKIPIYGIDTFEFLRAKNNNDDETPVVLFAGKSEIYIQFTKNSNPKIYKIEEGIKALKSRGIKKTIGELLEEQQQKFKEIKLIKSKKSFGKTMLLLNFQKIEKKHIVEPLYIKGPGISAPKPIK